MPSPSLEQGIEAYHQRQYVRAREIFWQVVQQNPSDHLGWGWLFQAIQSDEERLYCISQIRRLRSGKQPHLPDDKTVADQLWKSRGRGKGFAVCATPTTLPVGGAVSVITAFVCDAKSKPVSDGRVVEFRASDKGRLTEQKVATTNGIAQTLLVSGPQTSRLLVTAQLDPPNGPSDQTTVTFAAGPVHHIRLIPDTDTVTVGGATLAVAANVSDEYDNPVADGVTVRFDLANGDCALSPTLTGITAGKAETMITSGQVKGKIIVSAHAGNQSGQASFRVVKKAQRCLVCRRLIVDDTCPICQADNRGWTWGWRAHWPEFPLLFRLFLIFGLVAILAFPFVARADDLGQGITGISTAIMIVSIVLSCAICLVIYMARCRLREHELLRQFKKRKGPGLGILALAAIGVALMVLLAQGFLLWGALAYGSRSQWTAITLNSKTGAYEEIHNGAEHIVQPALSPDGKTLLYASDVSGNWEIYARDTEGNTLKLTNDPAMDTAPVWNKEGTEFTFASKQADKWELWTMTARGTNLQPLPGPVSSIMTRDETTFYAPASFSVATSTFFDSLRHQRGLQNRIAWGVRFLYVIAAPLVVMGLMLAGVKGFTERIDEKYPRPVFCNIDSLTRLALKSVHEHLRLREGEDGQAVGPSRLPVGMAPKHLADVTTKVSDSVEQLFHIPANKRQPLVLNSVVGRRDGGLGFLFEQLNDRRYYWVETDLDGKVSGIDGRPRVESLHIVSVDRSDSGGLKMVITRKIERAKKDEKTKETTFVTEDTRYEVEADEWGYIRSLQEKSDDKGKCLWAPTS